MIGENMRGNGFVGEDGPLADNLENLVWKDEVGGESWCGCLDPGREVLPCGHCSCGKGLCVELVREGAVFVCKKKAACEAVGVES